MTGRCKSMDTAMKPRIPRTRTAKAAALLLGVDRGTAPAGTRWGAIKAADRQSALNMPIKPEGTGNIRTVQR